MRKPKLVDRPRMAALETLPIFYNVQDRCVLIAGDGEGLAWKAELLSAAGAQIRVAAPTLSRELERVMALRPAQFERVESDWTHDALKDAALAIGDFSSDADAERFAKAAHAVGTPVNIVDKPKYCDFQFGSIVNRSPVVVSISTGGAAPALAQAIRSKIEVLLPLSISEWASAAQRLRTKLKALMPDEKRRRALWRNFADAAFSKPVSAIGEFVDRVQAHAHPTSGSVTLVGAGPGAAGLLTLDAVRALQSADIILFDDLVSDEVLDLARREAKRMMVGKRGHRESCRQDDINRMMLSLAKAGKKVVRLKSGDPMIFGRAGEEIAMLESAGVAVRIVPGVTAALAAAARLRTSLTHRDCAQGVKFVTAHSKQGALPDLDWRACVDGKTTLMVYMGARTAPALACRLISEGLAPETPVVIAAEVSGPNEAISTSYLADLSAKTINATGPVLIGIGQVFARTQRESAASIEGPALSTASLYKTEEFGGPALDVAAQQ
ncbi:MAG: siroheme synthase CysG [Pseudomonadota bacterium]